MPDIPGGERLPDAERIRELQAEPGRRVNPLEQKLLERFEAAGRPQRRLALLGAGRQPGAHGQDVRLISKKVLRGVPHEVDHLLDLGRGAEDVDLVEDDDNRLAPVSNAGEEEPFRLGERAIGGGDEQDEVGAGHEFGGDPLVLAENGVRARRVDDVDVAQQLGWRRDDLQPVGADLASGRVAMDQQMDLSRGGRDPFFKDRIPKQRVDEGALAGIELAHHHEEEELVELPHGRSERRLVRRGRAEFGQRIPDRGQQFACLCKLTGERRF